MSSTCLLHYLRGWCNINRGFITLATGEKYRKIAYNLLLSYRRFSPNPYPFSILTDQEDEYTKCFDSVIIIDNPLYSYMDKLKIEELTPYKETIFIDADYLVYRDINCYFDWFVENGSDFSVFGMRHSIEWENGYFKISSIKNQVAALPSYIPSFNGGIYYLHSGEKCKQVFFDANEFASHYNDFEFLMPSGDEPVLALSMAMHKCYPMESHPEGNTFVMSQKNYRTDPFEGRVEFEDLYGFESQNGYVVHWGNYNTIITSYLFDSWVFRTGKYKPTFFTELVRLYFSLYSLFLRLKRKYLKK